MVLRNLSNTVSNRWAAYSLVDCGALRSGDSTHFFVSSIIRITAKDKQKKWLFGTVGMAVIAAVLAEMMTVQAQNALLKTIEEPPEYAVIILLTSNIDALLPTIQSRCVRLDLKVVDDSLVKKYLMERLHVPDYQAEIDASFAQGSIGRAKDAATSEEFSAMTENALKILKYVNTMEVYELADEIKSLSGEKQNIGDYLDIFQFWFRDVLMFKATQEIDNLVFKQEINFIREQAKQRSYENLENILDSIQKTKVRLKANVNFDLAFELLFLTIREK